MFKRKSVNLAALLALGVVSAPALAQQQLERIEVTGSRIKTSNPETSSPVISLTAETIKIEGHREVEGLLNNLPSVFADQGAAVSNGASGTATVNMRNLGSNRNLVLINGRRMPAGSPRDLSADLNQIPVSLIKRVEVLTGGASAIYGSDAVSGVVNFVMNDKFEGVELDLNYQFYNHKQQATDIQKVLNGRAATNPAQFKVPGDKSSDGAIKDFSLTMGSNFANGKGNATVFVGRKQTDALLQSERDFTSCALNHNSNTGVWTCGGSGTSFPGQFSDFSNYAKTVADANGNVRNYVGATDQYNFGPTNYFQRPSNRSTAAAFIHYDVSDMARAYAELNFHDDHTVAQIAPSGAFGVFVNASYDNPLLSQAWKDVFHAANVADGLGTFNKSGDTHGLFILRRNVEGGGRQDDVRHTSYRGVIGVKGDINPMFSYDLFAQSGKVIYQETYKNDFSITRIGRALDVVKDGNGNAVCRSVVDGTDPNCVPWNIWSLGKVTPAALAYLQTPGFQKGFTSQTVVGTNIGGDLTDAGLKTPWARSGMTFSAGFERRTERMQLDTDTAFTTGDLAGQGGPTIGVGGGYSVNEAYTELRLPLIEKAPMAELLNISGAFRKSSYSTGQSTSTFGFGVNYKPVSMLQLRGSVQKAVRAANIIELFAARGLGLYDNDEDPCAGATPTATLAQCQRTGVTAAQYGKIVDNPALQYNQVGGGNPNLKPEEANSATFGVTFTPIRDLTVQLDYFKIKVEDNISAIPAPVTLQQCLETGNPLFCSKVHRDQAGTLWLTSAAYIEADNTNIGSVQTEGVDLVANYSKRLQGLGRVDVELIGTWLKSFEVEDLPTLAKYDCKGLFGDTCGTPMPEWRHKLRVTWATPWNLDLSASWRHFDKVEFDKRSSQSRLTGATGAQVPFLGARDYIDLSALYKFTKNLSVRVSIANLFDKDPPLRTQGSGFVNGNTYPVVYDAAGRRVNINLNAKF